MDEKPSQGPKLPIWVDRKTALQHCPVSATTLWRLTKQKDGIRTAKIGRRVFFDLRSIENFMEAQVENGNKS